MLVRTFEIQIYRRVAEFFMSLFYYCAVSNTRIEPDIHDIFFF